MNIKPEITMTSSDFERLNTLLDSLQDSDSLGIEELEAELDRANVVEPNEISPQIVTMNSTVKFVIESTNSEFEFTLVYPKDLDSSGKKISILAPVGSALLGLTPGDEIEWPKPGGGIMKVTIKGITYQPESAGDFNKYPTSLQ